MPTIKPETHDFEISRELILMSIRKQAGTLVKAVMEAVMNSIDAGATACDVNITTDCVTVKDNGKGFRGVEEAKAYFGVFGAPHIEGDAKFGRYRMGRAQMFNFGVNTWRSNGLRMVVDIDNNGLSYVLDEDPEPIDGCFVEIKLYSQFTTSSWEVSYLKSDIERALKYLDGRISVNGQKINKAPSEVNWDFEDEFIYLKRTAAGTLSIYNMGIHVKDFPGSRFGVPGVLVSKPAFDVNVARNDIMPDCNVWKHVQEVLKEHRSRDLVAKTSLTQDERAAIISDLLAGGIKGEDTIDKLKVVQDVNGRWHRIDKIRRLHTHDDLICVAPAGDRIGDTVHRMKLAFVLSEATLDLFGVETVQEFLDLLWPIAHKGYKRPRVTDVETFRDQISGLHKTISERDLNPFQSCVLTSLRRVNSFLACGLASSEGVSGQDRPHYKARQIVPGRSHVARMWTDGLSQIWVDQSFLETARSGLPGCTKIISVLVHEYIHDREDLSSHAHDQDFMESFHDICLNGDIVGQAAVRLLLSLESGLKRKGIKFNRAFSSAAFLADEIHNTEEAVA